MNFRLLWQRVVRIADGVDFSVSDLVFHDKILHFVFEGTKIWVLRAEYVCYGLLFLYLIKSVMNTRTIKNTHALFALCVFYLPSIRVLNDIVN